MLARKVSLVGYERGRIIQIKQDLYAFYGYSLTRYSDLNLVSGANIKSQSATPLTKRYSGYAISTFAEEFIFVSGGANSRGYLKSVEYFSVRSKKWAIAPAMNETRCQHSQCALGDSLFAFFGWKN